MSAARFVAATASLCVVAALAVAADGGGGSAEPAGAFRSLRLQIRSHPIPYSAERKSDMAAYAKRHYGAAGRVVGRSVQGRPIRAFRIGDPSSSRKALVVGSMHGNEPAGRDVVRALRRSDVRGVDVWVAPTINPDGLRASSRQNAHGVDLNRNFPYRWRLAGSPWSQYYSGPRPFSEPETRAVRRLTRELRPRVSIWYHQPWGHVVIPKRSRVTRRVARRYARIARFPAHRLHGRRARLRGTAVSWQKHVLRGRAAFVVELPAGSLSQRQVRRHARAALRVARGGSG